MTLHHNRYDVPVQLLVDKMLGKMNRDFEKNSKRYSFLMGQIQLQSGTPKLRFYLIFGRKIIPTNLIQQNIAAWAFADTGKGPEIGA